MQLSTNLKTFCRFFSPFLKSASNFKHFGERDESKSLCISKIADCPIVVGQMFQ